jgi:threonine dehydrogenase-like Zn-dependent dehydrogenase
MKANCWIRPNTVEIREVPDPQILSPRDAIIRVTSAAICGSDMHLYNGFVPAMRKGDVLGHEMMGEIVEVGSEVRDRAVGDRVVVAFPIACGRCSACAAEAYSICENSNPNASLAEKTLGRSPAGIFGYSHLFGGYPGGQAEYARVPYADVGTVKIEDDLEDERVVFLSDVLPTGWMAAEMCDVTPGDVIAVWGAGAVGLFAAHSAYLMGAERVIVIDRFDYRLRRARERAGAETLNYEQVDVRDALNDLTGGRGPDACIDAVGMEGHHGNELVNLYDRGKQSLKMETDRPHALRQAILSVRNGGTVSIIGAYAGFIDKFPIGAVMNRSLTIRSGQCHVQRYFEPLLDRIRSGELDSTIPLTHRVGLEEVPNGYAAMKNKDDEVVKVMVKP